MKNAERVARDVALIIKDLEGGRVSPRNAIKRIGELTAQSCEHCSYKDHCEGEHVSCYGGYLGWLDEEV
jgi:hypothetical protein